MKLTFNDIGSGKPIVLIHAFPLSKEMWKQQAAYLVKNGFRVITVDLPGFGENQPPRFATIEVMARQLDATLDYLKITQAIIGGLSMGGYVLLNLFRLSPAKFAALILCDTTAKADNEEKKKSRIDLISKIETNGSQALVENMLPNLVSEDTKDNKPELLEELKNTFANVNPESAKNALQNMAQRIDSTDVLSRINIPTLLVFGESDSVTNIENASKMNGLIQGSELRIIEKAGHFSNLEQPDKFNEALLEFCDRIKFND